MWTGKGEVRSYSNVDIRIVLWYDTLYSIVADDWILLYSTFFHSRDDRYNVQSFQYGKPCTVVGCGDRCALKKDEQRDTRCSEMVSSGILSIAYGSALCV